MNSQVLKLGLHKSAIYIRKRDSGTYELVIATISGTKLAHTGLTMDELIALKEQIEDLSAKGAETSTSL